MKPLRIAVVGCGHIRTQYGQQIRNYPDLLEIVGATDLELARAEEFCREYGGKVYPDFEAVLGDPEVDVVLNLTVHHAHFDLNSRALKAGKHVFTEKPMALTYAEAVELGRIARESGRLLSAAPITYLGEGIQTTAKFLEADRLGTLRLVYAEVNWAQIERWISAPAPYYTVGPLLDVGVYAITALTFLLGPVRKVWGYSKILKNPRFDKEGREFPVTAPDFTTGMMEFESGVVARLTTNYYVPHKTQTHLRGLEFHGDEGSFSVGCYHIFNPLCRFIPYGQEPVEIPLLREAKAGMDRALGLAEMALAIRENRPLRNSPEHAAHVIEIMEGLQTSSDECRWVEIRSNFEKPPLMDWAREAELVISEK
ncbi:MAG TPA: Gfo/Idh/MocA family oxidoreductase [Chthoniobacteraceae bacterium]|nr:Gfo/Idh/MocA family oxidoreductase [Chthoniobacteraceae bacterium]